MYYKDRETSVYTVYLGRKALGKEEEGPENGAEAASPGN